MTQPEETQVEETIDDIAARFDVKAPAEPEAVRNEPANPVFTAKLDPLDSDQVNQFAQSTMDTIRKLEAKLQSVEGQLNESRQTSRETQVEGEIAKAVELVGDGIVNDTISPAMIRGYMEQLYREDPSFKVIWDNRSQNPAAFKKALTIKNKELRGKFSNVTNDVLENHRAAKASQQAMSSKNQEPDDDPIAEELGKAKSQAEFDRIWAKHKRGSGVF